MSRIFLLLYVFTLFTFLPESVQAQVFKAGAAVKNITPDPLLPVSGGVGIPRPADTKLGELFVRALVLEKGKTRVAIVGIDNLGWPSTLANRTRALVKGIAPENILIGATHTHSAPDAYAFADEDGNHAADLTYLDNCVKIIAEAIQEAIDKLEPAQLKIAVDEAKGKIAYNYYAPQLYDPRCNVLQAVTSDGSKVIATMVNYAIHPEVLGNGQGILSPDLCGPLYDRIESKTGGIAIFMNGALGGMVTADNRIGDGKDERSWEQCLRIGNLLADEALRIIEKAPLQKNPVLYSTHTMLKLDIDSPMMRFILENSPLGHKTDADNVISTQLNLLNIGTAQMLTIPGEALPNIGYYLKRNMKGKHPFLLGLTNDAFGYIMVKEDFDSFKRYEYISRTSLGEMTGEKFINESLKLIENSPAPDLD
ncbi:MAG: hypothetical protein JJU28_21345 [Cyclobacteriaceae bacterium]|nr:hypothetical protein [Cyclobacteriaceae bacterium]